MTTFEGLLEIELILENIIKYLDKTQILILKLAVDLDPKIYKIAKLSHTFPYQIQFLNNKLLVTL